MQCSTPAPSAYKGMYAYDGHDHGHGHGHGHDANNYEHAKSPAISAIVEEFLVKHLQP